MKHLISIVILLCTSWLTMSAAETNRVKEVRKLNATTVEVIYEDGHLLTIDFYGNNIFRLFRDDNGGILRNPEAQPPAQILVDKPRKGDVKLDIASKDALVAIFTSKIVVMIDKNTGLLKVVNEAGDKTYLEQTAMPVFGKNGYTVDFKMRPDEYFFGGGVQNGRFSHAGNRIEIVNTNSWTDGGVASPNPFYWSTEGYGILCHTFAPGYYDFGKADVNTVTVSHETDYMDMFVMIDNCPVALLNDYYQLTGNPVLLPKFGFYEGHLNAYNRDYWTETQDTQRGILYEDGRYYLESQKENGGIRESLNGELDGNYQFSARAVIDRYNAADMPLGWVLPNDGYGAGYGQTETLEGNVQNLKEFGDYARSKGVEIGLWTQSNLHPVPDVSALLQRDIVREVRDAGVRILKTDVAWVGAGYSFGLNGIADVAEIMPYYGNQARPFIISLDGWAGTQRYAGIWTGDQTGGEWEYIRFHIPTYIGAALSGMSNITSDMDGIFGGKNVPVNVRDFEWKTFTPMQLNMDGWGSNPKYPQQLGEPAASINRSYLKWKSILMPYAYSSAREAVDGMPLIRAMFLEDPNLNTLSTLTQYQYLYGPNFLVAPIYQPTSMDKDGNDIRHNIYLPEGRWIDYYNGKVYEGRCMLNSYNAPLWKLPVFVKAGAIIPEANPSNNPSQVDKSLRIYEVYPYGESSFTEYDDDGVTDAYLKGESAETVIKSCQQGDVATITVEPTHGEFKDMVTEKQTVFVVNLTQKPKKVALKVNGKKIALSENTSGVTDYTQLAANTFAYIDKPNLNRFATPGTPFANEVITKNPQLVVKVAKCDIKANYIELTVNGFKYDNGEELTHSGTLANIELTEPITTAYTVIPTWKPQGNADYYEINFSDLRYTNIHDSQFLFEGLEPESKYNFSIRSVNADGASEWQNVTINTTADPLRYALRGLTGNCTAASQAGFGVERLFDFAEKGDIWHTDYAGGAVPFELDIDLHAFTTLDKLEYVPRENAGNGNIISGTYSISRDKKTWTEPVAFKWNQDNKTKTIDLKEAMQKLGTDARYIALMVNEAVGGYGSGAEIYAFQTPDSKIMIPGDINQDGKIDENDLTSYLNYTGLRQGDGDFEGYISKGDLNNNGLIDAYDISEVATKLDGGVYGGNRGTLSGEIVATPDKQQYAAGDDIVITVTGKNMQAINALSMILPYKETDIKFVSVEPVAVNEMYNMTYDRLHTNGDKVLYPTFVNIGNQHTLQDDATLFVLHFKAQRKLTLKQLNISGLLVDKSLNELGF